MSLRTCLLPVLLAPVFLFPLRAMADTGQALAGRAGAPLLGREIPPLVVKTIDGKALDLGALRGRKALYLKFWATWCVPCREQMPHLNAVQRTAGDDLQVVAVDIGFDDTREQIAAYRTLHGLKMPVVRDDDGRLGALFGLRVTPQHVVVGKNGRILHVGHLADAKLDAVLARARKQSRSDTEGSALAIAGVSAAQLGIGDAVPSQRLRTLEGYEVPLGDPHHRRSTVLAFISPWCETYFADTRPASARRCREVREWLVEHGRDRQQRWLAIASGLWATSKELRGYRNEHRIPVPLSMDDDGALFRRFGVRSLPAVVIVDTDGRVQRRLTGDALDGAALRNAFPRATTALQGAAP